MVFVLISMMDILAGLIPIMLIDGTDYFVDIMMRRILVIVTQDQVKLQPLLRLNSVPLSNTTIYE